MWFARRSQPVRPTPSTRRRRRVGFGIFAALALSAVGLTLGVPAATGTHIREADVRFKVTCPFDHSANDDPIVFPDRPGKAHLHDFFGARDIDASFTDYDDYVNNPAGTTCNDPEDLAGYWSPALYTGARKVDATKVTVYYRLGGKHGSIAPIPAGLRMIAGWQSGKPHPGANIAGWLCNEEDYRTLTPPTKRCLSGGHIKMVVKFPDCWNGDDLDSADHRSHMAYSEPNGLVGPAAANVCPPSHPVQLPQITQFVNFANLASGKKITGLASGDTTTVHMDFFNGWVESRMAERVQTCLIELQFCDSGG